MAIFSLLVGSMIGIFSALLGWLAFGMTLASALGLYLCVTLLVGFALILANIPADRSAETAEA